MTFSIVTLRIIIIKGGSASVPFSIIILDADFFIMTFRVMILSIMT
jgi:hypothetical protein